jgi:hypothetical protein
MLKKSVISVFLYVQSFHTLLSRKYVTGTYVRCNPFYTVCTIILCDLYPGLGEGVVVLYPVQDPGHAPEGVRLNVGPHLLRQTVNLK